MLSFKIILYAHGGKFMRENELPTNIRQVGVIEDGLRIYVEDYAHTYLKQYADLSASEKLAFLVGKHLIIDSLPVLFISGVIQGKFTQKDEGNEIFTEKSFFYAEQELERYFKGCQIVGWMQTQPGFGTNLSPAYAKYHEASFIEGYQVLMVCDPVERQNAFYIWNDDQTALIETRGYFVYYDKNPEMNEYMINNKLSKVELRKIVPEKSYEDERFTVSKPGAVNSKNEKNSLRRMVNLSTGLCAVLFVMCFIMGAGLIQNDTRLKKIESDLNIVTSTYNYLVGQINKQAQAVFAPDETAKNELPVLTHSPSPEVSFPPASTPEPEEVFDGLDFETGLVVITLPPKTPEPIVVPSLPPEGDSEDALSDTPEFYIVEKGDSLTFISMKFYGTTDMVSKIMEANNMADPDKIYFGKKLILPKQ